MTNRQVYMMLARIAGHICADGQAFVKTEKFNKSDMRKIQSGIRALLEKLDYDRAFNDFGRTIRRMPVSFNPSSEAIWAAIDGASLAQSMIANIDDGTENSGQP